MEIQPVLHSTFVIERSYPAAPERVFAAFADPGMKRRWYVDREKTEVNEYSLDFRVGGLEHVVYTPKEGKFAGVVFRVEGITLEVVPNRRIVSASTMAYADHIFSGHLITVELLPSESGTDVVFTHQGAFLEGSDGPQIREQGWTALLDRLGSSLAQ